MKTLVVTGGAGFIGSALVRILVRDGKYNVVNVDALTYAGNRESLADADDSPRHTFVHADIRDANRMGEVFSTYKPVGVIHLAAESHVDRSIDGPADFIETNVVGTFTLLQEARRYWSALKGDARDAFRFIHVSTDEVFGSLGAKGFFTETTPYNPSSPYSASKAASDHLARAWHHTFGVPTMITNCSNNYGPYQFPEKLIPLMIQNGIAGKKLPVYGKGENVRDWLYVDDHVRALLTVFEKGRVGETYCVGGNNEHKNLDTVQMICDLLDQLAGSSEQRAASRRTLIEFVTDRPGHDLRYAIDSGKIQRKLGWRPQETFESGLRKTVAWYLANQVWCERVQSGAYRGERLGLGASA